MVEQEVFWRMLAPLPFASLFGRKVALDVTSFRLPSLREEWLVFVVMGLGVLGEKRLGVFSLFSVMLMDTPGFGRAAVL